MRFPSSLCYVDTEKAFDSNFEKDHRKDHEPLDYQRKMLESSEHAGEIIEDSCLSDPFEIKSGWHSVTSIVFIGRGFFFMKKMKLETEAGIILGKMENIHLDYADDIVLIYEVMFGNILTYGH